MTAPNRARATSGSAQRAGTFTTQWTDDQVLDLVAALARAVRPEAPHRASMAQCKNELIRRRRQEPGLRTAPAPEAVHLRFNATPGTMTWAEILQRALTPPEARTMQLAADGRVEAAGHLGPAHVAFALSRVARELRTTTVKRRQYEPTRHSILEADARRRGGVRLARLMPTKGQIDTICGGNWSTALRLAGLDVEPAEPENASRRGAFKPPGLPVAQAAVVFVAVNGFTPGVHVLEKFAAACGFSLAEYSDWHGELAEAERLLAERGLSPTHHDNRRGGAGRRTRWSYPQSGVPGAPPRAEPLGAVATRQLCELAFRVWDLRLPARAKRNLESYQAWRVGTIWPALKAVQRSGGLSALRAGAQAANAEDLRAGADREALADELSAQGAALIDASRPNPPTNWDLDAAIEAVQRAPKIAAPTATAERPRDKRYVTLGHLVNSGLLDQNEKLISTYGGVRREATFDEHGVITIDGLGEARTLGGAAELVVGSPRHGWKLWRVQREGELVLLEAVRQEFLTRDVGPSTPSE